MVDQLVVPGSFTGVHVERNQAGAEKVIAGTEAAVEINGRAVRRNVDQASLLIG